LRVLQQTLQARPQRREILLNKMQAESVSVSPSRLEQTMNKNLAPEAGWFAIRGSWGQLRERRKRFATHRHRRPRSEPAIFLNRKNRKATNMTINNVTNVCIDDQTIRLVDQWATKSAFQPSRRQAVRALLLQALRAHELKAIKAAAPAPEQTVVS
jgi:hypothetical protein